MINFFVFFFVEQDGSSCSCDCHQSGPDWRSGRPCLLPQAPVLSDCGVPHQKQSQYGSKLSLVYFDNESRKQESHIVICWLLFPRQVLYIQAFVLVFLLGKLMRKVFFGQLRAAEMEVGLSMKGCCKALFLFHSDCCVNIIQHLIERSWYAVTETCLAFTVFRDDFSPRFVALFTLLLFLKCFHWLAEDRVDFVSEQFNGTCVQ